MPRKRKAKGMVRPSGILVIDKEIGVSSFAVVKAVRQMLNLAKVGHTGTLDPLASGVLPLCLNEATKVASLLLADDKCYRAEGILGKTSDSYDSTGKILYEKDITHLDEPKVEQAILSFVGKMDQVPPAFSALHVDGLRAYERAREGEKVELAPRPIEIYRIRDIDIDLPKFSFEVLVSKGTYIRSLIHDIGLRLGCGALLSRLKRVQSGSFTIDQAIKVDSINALSRDELARKILPLGVGLDYLPSVELDLKMLRDLNQGKKLDFSAADCERVRLLFDQYLCGFAEIKGNRLLPKRIFRTIVEDCFLEYGEEL